MRRRIREEERRRRRIKNKRMIKEINGEEREGDELEAEPLGFTAPTMRQEGENSKNLIQFFNNPLHVDSLLLKTQNIKK